MVKQKEINQIEENKSSDVITILDKAIEKELPAKPKKIPTILNSFAIGIIISLLIIIPKFLFSKYFKSEKKIIRSQKSKT